MFSLELENFLHAQSMVKCNLYAFYLIVNAHMHTNNKFGSLCCIFHKKYHQFELYDPETF